jgi:hypothetical protein
VCFSTVVVGVLAVFEEPLVELLAVLVPLDFVVVELALRVVVLVDLGALAVVPLRITFVGAAPCVCSAAVTESSGVFACAARPRSVLSDGSAGLSLLHATDRATTGAMINILSPAFIMSSWFRRRKPNWDSLLARVEPVRLAGCW